MTEPGGNSERRRVIAGLVAGLLRLAGCGGGGSGDNGATAPQPPSPPPPPPPPAPIDVSVTPAAASAQTGGTQPFTATVTNTANRAVIWQVNGVAGGNTSVGTISTTGVYTAPATVPSPAIVTVTAVSVADPTRSGSAQVTITATAPTPVTVSVAPAAASVQTGGRQTFTATVTNTANKAVTWQVNGVTGGNTSVGTVSTTGVYTAPATVPSPAIVTVTAVSVADPTRSGSAQVTVTAPPPSTSWLWGVTTDDSTVQTASQVSAVAAFSKRVTIRAVFDPPAGGSPAATDYLSSVQALSAKADVMGLPVDSSAMSQLTTAAIGARIGEYISALGPYVRIWEIGNEVNGNWLGQDVITKVETMYDAAKAAGKLTALTLYYENPSTPGYEMISWVDQNIPPGHRMRSGLDSVLVSYYEDQNAGHQLTQSELDTMFSALAARFTSASLGLGECGWGGQIPSDNATRAALIQRFYGYRVPSVPRYIGGCFYWHFLQTMVPNGTPDWTVLQSLMSTA